MVSIIRTLFIFSAMATFMLSSCNGPSRERVATRSDQSASEPLQPAPVFNQDSAFAFVEKQVSFGPRVPNTQAHRDCGEWLQQTLERFADTVYVQEMRLRAYDGTLLNARNIIGSFQPMNRNRVLLCAHWDSRPYADHDPDPANHFTPIDGANDGGSGVGVLLEIARILSEHNPRFGIDIILFDAEDYGQHESHRGRNDDSWALGSQFWARNPHLPDYNARYGILLDMVGAHNAVFRHEGFSRMYASHIINKVWGMAKRKNFGEYFRDQDGGYVTDDHYYINSIRNIPTINIIHQDPGTSHGFFPQWHTVDDTIEHISRETLGVVGQTLLYVIFEDP